MAIPAPQIDSFTSHFFRAREESRRLVVVLHGRGDSLEGFLWLPGAISLSRLNYLSLNAPLEAQGGYAWYPLEPDPVPDILRGRAKLIRLFAELEAQGWDSREIVLFGFSQGCVMATDFALRWEKPLGGLIGVSGYIYFPDTLEAEISPEAKEQPWLITHGTHDPILPIERTRSQVRRLKELGLRIDWLEVHKDHSMDPGAEVAAIRDWIMQRFP